MCGGAGISFLWARRMYSSAGSAIIARRFPAVRTAAWIATCRPWFALIAGNCLMFSPRCGGWRHQRANSSPSFRKSRRRPCLVRQRMRPVGRSSNPPVRGIQNIPWNPGKPRRGVRIAAISWRKTGFPSGSGIERHARQDWFSPDPNSAAGCRIANHAHVAVPRNGTSPAHSALSPSPDSARLAITKL